MKRDLALDAGQVPAVFVVSEEATRVQDHAVQATQFGLSVPVGDSILHGGFPFAVSLSSVCLSLAFVLQGIT